MNKEKLIENITTAHRQLERYLFYFEKKETGQFSAGQRLKLSQKEMLESGIYGEWSLKDLLAFLIEQERHTAAQLAGVEVEINEWLPKSGSSWSVILDTDHVPYEIKNVDLEEVLERFPHSFEELYASVVECREEELVGHIVQIWNGEYPFLDYVYLSTVELYDWIKGLVRKWNKRHTGKRLNKQLILERIRTERHRLEGNLDSISHQDMLVSGVVGNWSVKDLMAHLVEWESMFMGWYEAGLHGEVPEIPAQGYTWNEMDLLNEHIYQKHRNRPLEEVLEDFEDSYQRVYRLVEGIPEEEIFAVGSYEWVGEENLVPYILANTANHYRWAKEKVRAWRRE